jgi:hypothetical protein
LLKKVGNYILIAAFIVAIVVIPALFIVGAVKLGTILFPFLELASILFFGIVVLLIVPLSFFQTSRAFAANALLISSYIFALTLWVEALLVTKILWGTIGVVVGLLLAGFGIVPVGILASLFSAAWPQLCDLIVLAILTWGLRIYAFWVAARPATIDPKTPVERASLDSTV